MKYLLLILLLTFVSCSSIHQTFIYPEKKGEKIFAGTANNIDWVSNPPSEEEIYPYSVMGIIDFLPSVLIDVVLLPYTLYDKYSE